METEEGLICILIGLCILNEANLWSSSKRQSHFSHIKDSLLLKYS